MHTLFIPLNWENYFWAIMRHRDTNRCTDTSRNNAYTTLNSLTMHYPKLVQNDKKLRKTGVNIYLYTLAFHWIQLNLLNVCGNTTSGKDIYLAREGSMHDKYHLKKYTSIYFVKKWICSGRLYATVNQISIFLHSIFFCLLTDSKCLNKLNFYGDSLFHA